MQPSLLQNPPAVTVKIQAIFELLTELIEHCRPSGVVEPFHDREPYRRAFAVALERHDDGAVGVRTMLVFLVDVLDVFRLGDEPIRDLRDSRPVVVRVPWFRQRRHRRLGNGTSVPLLLTVVQMRLEFIELLATEVADIGKTNRYRAVTHRPAFSPARNGGSQACRMSRVSSSSRSRSSGSRLKRRLGDLRSPPPARRLDQCFTWRLIHQLSRQQRLPIDCPL